MRKKRNIRLYWPFYRMKHLMLRQSLRKLIIPYDLLSKHLTSDPYRTVGLQNVVLPLHSSKQKFRSRSTLMLFTLRCQKKWWSFKKHPSVSANKCNSPCQKSSRGCIWYYAWKCGRCNILYSHKSCTDGSCRVCLYITIQSQLQTVKGYTELTCLEEYTNKFRPTMKEVADTWRKTRGDSTSQNRVN